MKRKASNCSPYERPAKMTKRNTSVTVSRTLSTLSRTTTTITRPTVTAIKWPSLKLPTSKAIDTSSELASLKAPGPIPGLRRAPTIPVEEKDEATPLPSRKSTKNASVKSMVASLAKRESTAILDKSGNVTTLKRLPSGSSVGEMTSLSAAPADVGKELSKASSRASLKGTVSISLPSVSVVENKVTDDGGEALSEEGGVKEPSRVESVRKESLHLATSSSTAGPSTFAVPLPPGGLIEIVFSFDTTGSMSSCIAEVRGRVGDMIQRLQADIPGIRIAVVAHGDYCDASNYIIKWIDFGASLPEMCDFVQNISATGGGDFDECYELVLARIQTELSWTPGSQRSLVMIGDATPHPAKYYAHKEEKLDWEKETRKLANLGVKIYAVQALNHSQSTKFYSTLAKITGGRHLKLDQFNNICDIIMTVCYSEKGAEFVQAYEEEVRTREGGKALHKDLESMFGALRGVATPSTKSPGVKKALAKRAAKVKKTSPKKPVAKTVKTTTVNTGTKPTKRKPQSTKSKLFTPAKAKAKTAKGKGVQALKSTKMSKAHSKKTLKTKSKAKKTKKKSPGVNKKFRESVPDSEISKKQGLTKVHWSSWSAAMLPSKPIGKSSFDWKPRRHSAIGMRNVHIFHRLPKTSHVPSIYEFAVKLRRKLYVVYFCTRASWRKNLLWDTNLLNRPALYPELDAVLTAGGSLFARWGQVKNEEKLKKVEEILQKNYDYAWKPRKLGREKEKGKHQHRRIKRNGVVISGNTK